MSHALFVAVALVSCVEDDGAAPSVGAEQTLSPAARAACHADYGEVVIGLFGNAQCARPTMDSGQGCSASTQCEGYCEPAALGGGECSATNFAFGCIEQFEDGEIVTVCYE